ncbi:DSBA-like thioredoxin domain-containing protein [Radiomyces spectabilis]|uniref:DSBA-like thioredoxin domain-containing protein n=1 Tax=Radiomyces spectabilis TaxID=64574 RepID=UPI002220583B|nr:DSBA-like thioredoxin domain-containing protein [Radiomyces spectabilis]KAI8365375.1 DSBA-like thioredoxin domain-containing protein [Radiomyces spectabilis]
MLINVAVTIDTICPWCFIGKRRLEKAIRHFTRSHPNVQFDVTWHPFQLDSTMTKLGRSKLEHYRRKFGPEKSLEIQKIMEEVGRQEKIQFSYNGDIGNTFDSHRLIYWARSLGKQNEIVEELFKLYFEEEKNLGVLDTLVMAARRAGIDTQKATDYLNSDENVDIIQDLLLDTQKDNFQGVPNIKIADKYTLVGAEEPFTILALFEKVVASSVV